MPAESLAVRASVAFPGFRLELDESIALNGVTALLGPSGSGKSTLLRAIAGFERPASGRIALGADVWFDGAARLDVPAHRRPVGFLFQDGRLFPHLDVAGNLEYAEHRADSASGLPRGEVVEALDLSPLLQRRVQSLSGGEAQRVALARTLLISPQLLLLDEPLAALDADSKADILPYLETIPKRFAVPAIYVSHSLDEVVQLASNVIVLAAGRVRAHGPARETLERLDLEPLTGRFDGGVILEGCVVRHDERLSLTHFDVGGATLAVPAEQPLAPGDTRRLRIRARDVALATQRPEAISIRNVLPAEVAEVVPQPGTPFAEVYVLVGTTRIRARLTRAAVEDLRLQPEMPVFALIKSVSFDSRGPRAR